jgi:hypothetical protein
MGRQHEGETDHESYTEAREQDGETVHRSFRHGDHPESGPHTEDRFQQTDDEELGEGTSSHSNDDLATDLEAALTGVLELRLKDTPEREVLLAEVRTVVADTVHRHIAGTAPTAGLDDSEGTAGQGDAYAPDDLSQRLQQAVLSALGGAQQGARLSAAAIIRVWPRLKSQVIPLLVQLVKDDAQAARRQAQLAAMLAPYMSPKQASRVAAAVILAARAVAKRQRDS